MAKYVVLFTYTPETWQKMMATPSDREAEASAMATRIGGSLESIYFMFGGWDGFAIFTAPDSGAAATLSVAIASTGAFGKVETHELIETSAMGDVLAKAKAAVGGYRPPGA